jgi:hypothetical protein
LFVAIDDFGASVGCGDDDLGDITLRAQGERDPRAPLGGLPAAALATLRGDQSPLDVGIFGHGSNISRIWTGDLFAKFST